ncbi:ABC-ATPase domain-containing protein [Dubosiella newyorkensis]|uniref:ABC-ATPase domain-containing protein n=1 Tax=Dubosiella newyorkensis TaxID=1862672 RepID=UPI0025737EB3|nr:ABC-ATPase domain-containing protein [Dubosiella newyorkensis]
MKTKQDLIQICQRIQGRGYPAYKDCRGEYTCPSYILSIDHVQGDPFAAPSDVSIRVPNTFPKKFHDTKYRRVSLEDRLLRFFVKQLKDDPFRGKGSGKSGVISISKPKQEVLERSAIRVEEETITLRFHVGFPANGRKVLSLELLRILFDYLPSKIESALLYEKLSETDREALMIAHSLADDQHALREAIKEKGLVAFVANGSILPRKSGVSQKPMEEAVPFLSPSSLEVKIVLPHRKEIKGMGIPKGITLIIGGGYHGKSTLLMALERGIYDHIDGDGREFVVCDPTAIKSRAEDGRSVHNDFIETFIRDLPNHKSTKDFSTEDASGSTSQAASVSESLEAGCKLLLMDEDTSAANFMVRDALMQKVVHRDQEPIVPLVDRIEQLYEMEGCSTILVAGSSGAFFEVADLVIQMDQYIPLNVTDRAKEMALAYPSLCSPHTKEKPEAFYRKRVLLPGPIGSKDRIKVKTQGLDAIILDQEPLDVRLIEQLIDPEQLPTLGAMVLKAHQKYIDGKRTLGEVADLLMEEIEKRGLSVLGKRDFCQVRKQDFMAVMNRYRSQKMKQKR